jgi:hypothetical protein
MRTPAVTDDVTSIHRHVGERRPAGWILAHNHVAHTTRHRSGTRGFRVFWAEPNDWVVCDCGWRPELGVHYRHPALTPDATI